MRTRHEEMPLIGNLESPLDAGESFHGGGADHHDSSVPKVFCSGDGKIHGVAFRSGAGGVAVHLVQQKDTDRA